MIGSAYFLFEDQQTIVRANKLYGSAVGCMELYISLDYASNIKQIALNYRLVMAHLLGLF